MSDLLNRLAALHSGTPGVADDSVVTTDLNRGRAAASARRRRRTVVAGAATLGLVAAGSLSFALTSGSDSHSTTPAAGAKTVTTHGAAPSTTTKNHPSTKPTIKLVAYDGDQLPGYTVSEIPAGYVLQGISGSVLDVSVRGDKSSLDTFVGKIVVMLNDHPAPANGDAVTVNGHAGVITDQDGVQSLYYTDAGRNVQVQSWSNINITRDQLVQFAEGVTILPSAQVGHG